MTNKERYQKAFRTLHASENFMGTTEEKPAKLLSISRFLPAAALLALVLGLSTIAYAVDFCGIRRSVRYWIHGKPTTAIVEIQDGSYTMTYEDERGNLQELKGEGIAIYPDGKERPITEEEILDDLDHPEVECNEDGRICVYYHSQCIDITDRFENELCRIKLEDKGKTLYMLVRDEGNGACSFCISSLDYPDPEELH